jgi:uncharacterized protein YndB with AHSA1/START domain
LTKVCASLANPTQDSLAPDTAIHSFISLPWPGGHFVVFFEERAVEGRYVELDPPRRLVITWGRAGSQEFGPGSSTLEVSLRPEGTGTRVEVVHLGLPEAERPRHALGWRHYLDRLGRVAEGKSVPPHHTPENLTEGLE